MRYYIPRFEVIWRSLFAGFSRSPGFCHVAGTVHQSLRRIRRQAAAVLSHQLTKLAYLLWSKLDG